MHCPKCGQQQMSDEIRYCSRCGFLLTGVAEIVSNDGILPGHILSQNTKTPRKQGVKQGAFIFLVGLVLVPIWILFLVASNGPPELAVAAAIFFLGATVLRIAYALLFASTDPTDGNPVTERQIPHRANDHVALPYQTSVPADVYAPPAVGRWKDTNEFVQQPSVTDTTTKLLAKEENQ